ncbi:hypothetical protein D9M68_646190 [compost metagenome]
MAYTPLPALLKVLAGLALASGVRSTSTEPPRPLTKPAPVSSPPPDRSSSAPWCPTTLSPVSRMPLLPMARLSMGAPATL